MLTELLDPIIYIEGYNFPGFDLISSPNKRCPLSGPRILSPRAEHTFGNPAHTWGPPVYPNGTVYCERLGPPRRTLARGLYIQLISIYYYLFLMFLPYDSLIIGVEIFGKDPWSQWIPVCLMLLHMFVWDFIQNPTRYLQARSTAGIANQMTQKAQRSHAHGGNILDRLQCDIIPYENRDKESQQHHDIARHHKCSKYGSSQEILIWL